MTTPVPSPKSPAPKLGIFGGSFDPVHCAHLELARACQQQARLDEVWFTPTAIQPLKQGGPQAGNAERIDMLRAAINDEATWILCTLEIDRGGYSYTVDTLRRIHQELPDASLFFLMGADALRDVPNWKEPAEIFRLATPLVVGRAGEPGPDLSALSAVCTAETQPLQLEMRAMHVSSSEIRGRIAAGQPLEGLVPTTVAEYIQSHGLYR
jgi:nicotinate-nucleotide adenylyltransferase